MAWYETEIRKEIVEKKNQSFPHKHQHILMLIQQRLTIILMYFPARISGIME